MLPTSADFFPPRCKIAWISDAVVLLPFVPVTPTIVPEQFEKNSSVCEVTFLPDRTARTYSGSVTGMPGDFTITSCCAKLWR